MRARLVSVLLLLVALAARPAGAGTLIVRSAASDPYGFGAATAGAPDSRLAPAPAALPAYVPPRRNAGRALGEIFLVNALVWSYNRYIREGDGVGFRIGFASWKENLLNGFEWDDNTFSTNQFAHPFHGSLYYNAARANGFDYWTSAPFAFAGSFMWEYFGETHHPSINDWFATSIGGMALGETTFRLSQVVTDNTATGAGRVGREAAGLLLDPLRGINRLISGDAGRVCANPPDRKPESYAVTYHAGARTTSETNLWNADTTRAYIAIAARYGDPFLREYRKPYDSFELELQVNFGDASSIGEAAIRGILFGSEVHESETTHHVFAVYQHYDYLNTNAFVFGGQSAGISFLSRVRTSKAFEVRSTIELNAMILGAVKSDYPNISGRSYDYGPGLGFHFAGAFVFRGRPFLTLVNSEYWIKTFNGTVSEHFLATTRVRVEVPIQHGFGAGVDYVLYTADSRYRDFPDVYKKFPELRIALAFNQ